MTDDHLLCTLPVVRLDRTAHEAWAERYENAKRRLDAGEMTRWLEENPEIEPHPAIAVCGEPLFVEGRTTADLTVEDLTATAATGLVDLDHYGNAWRVQCASGHVLLVPDDGGNDDLPGLVLTHDLLMVGLTVALGLSK